MFYTLTLNPAVDYVVSLGKFEYNTLNRMTSGKYFPGGKGVNVSLVLSGLGKQSTMLGFIGGKTGGIFLDLLSKYNVVCDFLELNNFNTRINIKLLHEGVTEINGDAVFEQAGALDILYDKLDKLSRGDILILGGSVPFGISDTIYGDISLRLNRNGVVVLIDAQGNCLNEGISGKPFLVKPNLQELCGLFSKEIKELDDIERYAREIQERGVRNVLVSMGENGALLVSEKGEAIFCEAVKPSGEQKRINKNFNTVGAGDTLLAGFAYYFFKTGDYRYSLERAVELSGKSVFSEWIPV